MNTTHCDASVSATRSSSDVKCPCFAVDHLQHADQRRSARRAAPTACSARRCRSRGRPRGRRPDRACVGDVDDLARARGQPEDALREAGSHRSGARPPGQYQLRLVRLVQPDRGALCPQYAARSLADLGKHGRQVEGRRQLAGDLEDLQQCLGAQGRCHRLDVGRHRESFPCHFSVCGSVPTPPRTCTHRIRRRIE